MERTIGVFGEELLLWVCLLLQSPRRPPADHVFRQANLMLDELITRTYPLDQINEAYGALIRGEVARSLIVF